MDPIQSDNVNFKKFHINCEFTENMINMYGTFVEADPNAEKSDMDLDPARGFLIVSGGKDDNGKDYVIVDLNNATVIDELIGIIDHKDNNPYKAVRQKKRKKRREFWKSFWKRRKAYWKCFILCGHDYIPVGRQVRRYKCTVCGKEYS